MTPVKSAITSKPNYTVFAFIPYTAAPKMNVPVLVEKATHPS